MALPKTLTLIAAATTLFAMVPATASAASAVKSLEVDLKGYDLSDAQDAQIVLQKITRAADRTCRTPAAKDTIRERIIVKACMTSATYKAVSSLDAPVLMAAYKQAKVS